MYAAPGVGLAAIQVGIGKSLLIVALGSRKTPFRRIGRTAQLNVVFVLRSLLIHRDDRPGAGIEKLHG